MTHPKDLRIADYSYDLPKEKIAYSPLPNREDSKLLIWNGGKITDSSYKQIANEFTAGSLLIFNDTRVIPARITFVKETGSIIEIFLLKPLETTDYQEALSQKNEATWKCLIGGLAKWKEAFLVKELIINDQIVELRAAIFNRNDDSLIVQFSWSGDITWSEILDHSGAVPLPPYIKRKPEADDKIRYQTLYAKKEGSVAAPTAGLHFSNSIFADLKRNKIDIGYVTLHVGAGTFMPVKSLTMKDHQMHEELIDVQINVIRQLLANDSIVAIGTTSARTLESLYWMGIKAHRNRNIKIEELPIKQWEPYHDELGSYNISSQDALQALINWMENHSMERLVLRTQIIIAPGYSFRVIKKLVTNFHQPQSTLLLLIAAAIGEDWRTLYDYALNNEYRFLSYGDGCLINIKNIAT
ncbi:MAG: S-adenosylmethionine:tRNA ribosyltransferase-isomerase [Ginsengibacter sp.]